MPPATPVIVARRALLALAGIGLARPLAAAVPLRPAALDRLGAVGLAASRLRIAGALSLGEMAASGVAEAGALASLALPGVEARDQDTLLRMFFTTSQISLGNALGGSPVVGFYSPTLDLWWLTRWTAAPRPVATGGKLLPGGALSAGVAATDTPRWIAGLGRSSAIALLRESVREAEGEFAAEFSPLGAAASGAYDAIASGPGERRLAVVRLMRQAGAIARLTRDARAWPPFLDALNALTDDTAATPAGLSPQAMAGFVRTRRVPSGFRRNLAPVAAAEMRGGWLVAAANPLTGRFLLLSALLPGQPTPIARIAMIDTAGA